MITNEMMHNAMKEAIIFNWNIFKPYLVPFIIGFIVWGACKLFARKIVRFISVVSGDTRRETKRKLKKSDDLIDLISTVNDIRPKK